MPKLSGIENKELFGYHIDKENDQCAYNDKDHIYFTKDNGSKCISTTQLIHNYIQPFDSDFWSSYKACESILGSEFSLLKKELLNTKKWDSEYLSKYNIDENIFLKKKNEILQSYKDKNKEACEYGSAIHEKMENLFYQKDNKRLQTFGYGGKINNINVEKGNYKFDKENAIYPEILLSYIADEYLKVCGQADLVIKEGNDISIYDWKGLPLETNIPTLNGFIKMKDLKEGDYVFDKNGELTKVIHKSKIHNNDCYKIIFDNNDEIICDKDHLWEVSLLDNNSNLYTYTTEQLYLNIKNNKYIIFNSKPLNLPDKKLKIDPYLFGYFIPNLKSIEIKDYLRASYNQRLELLRGIMDNIGTYDSNKDIFIITCNKLYTDIICELLSTFGIKYKLFLNNILFKTSLFNPFRIKFKNLKINQFDNYRIIKDIIKVPEVQTQCIEVDSFTHTYLCTEKFIVTHNTSKSIDLKSFYNKITKKYQMMKFPLNNIMDCNYYIYSLQLSLYMYMIEKMNPKFKCKKLSIIHIDKNGNEKEYKCDYLKDDIIRMLLHYRREQKIKSQLDLDKPIIF